MPDTYKVPHYMQKYFIITWVSCNVLFHGSEEVGPVGVAGQGPALEAPGGGRGGREGETEGHVHAEGSAQVSDGHLQRKRRN